MRWYILRVAKGQDKKVKTAIEEQLNRYKINDLVHDIIIPTEKEIKLKNGKKIITSKNMLAGYVFVNADISNPLVVDIINDTPGSYGFMGENKKTPSPLKQTEVDKMLGSVSDDDVVVENPWIKGEKIKIIEGPFNGFEGEVTENNSSKQKLNVEVKIFGRPTPLELDYYAVERIN